LGDDLVMELRIEDGVPIRPSFGEGLTQLPGDPLGSRISGRV
jgi:hypothetical protein